MSKPTLAGSSRGKLYFADPGNALIHRWYRCDTWPAAMAGVRALYVAYHPDIALPVAADHVGAPCALAVESGVRRIVLLSGRGEQGVLPSEHAVRHSGAAFTILRCAYVAQNFSEAICSSRC